MSIGTRWKYEPLAPGSAPAPRSMLAMYSAARRPPRVAGARPSSRSELRKRRCPSISAALIGALAPVVRCAAPGDAQKNEASVTAGIARDNLFMRRWLQKEL